CFGDAVDRLDDGRIVPVPRPPLHQLHGQDATQRRDCRVPSTSLLRRRGFVAAAEPPPAGVPASAFPAAVAWFGEAFVPAWPPAGDRRPLRGRIGRRRTRAQPPAERLLRPGRGRSAQSPRLNPTIRDDSFYVNVGV